MAAAWPLPSTHRELLALLNSRVVWSATPGIDWNEISLLADRLWLGVRLAARADDPQIPARVRERWGHTRRANAAHTLLLEREEANLLALLADAGVEAVPLKGTSLARILTGNPASRPVTDIDLGVRGAQVVLAADALRATGYEVALPAALLQRHGFVTGTDEHTSEVKCTREVAGVRVLVELHWKWLPLPEPLIWSSLESYAEAGVRTLCPEHYFLFLCSHLAGGNWAGLRWLCDIADFLVAFRERVDSAACLRLVRLAHLRRAVGVTLAMLDDFFAMRTSVLDELRDDRARRIARRFCARTFQPFLAGSVGGVHRDRLRGKDNARQQFAYLARLLRPTPLEWLTPERRVRPAFNAWMLRMGRLARLAFRPGGAA